MGNGALGTVYKVQCLKKWKLLTKGAEPEETLFFLLSF